MTGSLFRCAGFFRSLQQAGSLEVKILRPILAQIVDVPCPKYKFGDCWHEYLKMCFLDKLGI